MFVYTLVLAFFDAASKERGQEHAIMPSPSLHDTSFDMEYVTRESREASFAPPSKRQKGGWPHKSPSAADLAGAGFYFNPQPHSNDNTVCFLCDRNLDGWEAEDDPVQEHLKHAPDCGWARLMSVESEGSHDTSNMDDPTGQQITDARRATFGVGWPHETKRGWTCKIEKMVEAGWYFAPTVGSEDYVSCAYCKLSLDGWEPKDNPFEEHHSRSPWCPFFVFAGTTAPSKRPKAKKGRTSRTSRASRTSKASTRLSTQSNVTLQSEAPSIPDLDESIDTSAVSILSTMSTATAKAKRKAGAGRSKTTKSKRTKTTKSKKADEDPPEVDVSEEATADTISYPQINQNSEQTGLQETAVSIDTLPQDIVTEEKPTQNSPAQSLGPPRLPTPTIPAVTESPVPVRSTSRRSLPKPVLSQPKPSTPTPQSSPAQLSDVENAPPSTRPKSDRPPVLSPGVVPPRWEAVDVDMIFEGIPGVATVNTDTEEAMNDAEKQMTVQEWVKHIATKAEDDLRAEGERVVGIFEKEGQRALSVLERIVCV